MSCSVPRYALHWVGGLTSERQGLSHSTNPIVGLRYSLQRSKATREKSYCLNWRVYFTQNKCTHSCCDYNIVNMKVRRERKLFLFEMLAMPTVTFIPCTSIKAAPRLTSEANWQSFTGRKSVTAPSPPQLLTNRNAHLTRVACANPTHSAPRAKRARIPLPRTAHTSFYRVSSTSRLWPKESIAVATLSAQWPKNSHHIERHFTTVTFVPNRVKSSRWVRIYITTRSRKGPP
jgi:hypothetical protein